MGALQIICRLALTLVIALQQNLSFANYSGRTAPAPAFSLEKLDLGANLSKLTGNHAMEVISKSLPKEDREWWIKEREKLKISSKTMMPGYKITGLKSYSTAINYKGRTFTFEVSYESGKLKINGKSYAFKLTPSFKENYIGLRDIFTKHLTENIAKNNEKNSFFAQLFFSEAYAMDLGEGIAGLGALMGLGGFLWFIWELVKRYPYFCAGCMIGPMGTLTLAMLVVMVGLALMSLEIDIDVDGMFARFEVNGTTRDVSVSYAAIGQRLGLDTSLIRTAFDAIGIPTLLGFIRTAVTEARERNILPSAQELMNLLPIGRSSTN